MSDEAPNAIHHLRSAPDVGREWEKPPWEAGDDLFAFDDLEDTLRHHRIARLIRDLWLRLTGREPEEEPHLQAGMTGQDRSSANPTRPDFSALQGAAIVQKPR